ncbi:alkaline phosphatase family protein [Fusibacter ferrireducens]|uniref:Alkaline phosphatase family protein n=1 Tax=Fusibacter ferrireducens TaxID=2785058 RepID=A0ABR9ZS76_9FIRM|nr:ectonucleotide pyrophosphatase/phosphodiesterase [Fusibacter ferrireducens]MBF4692760.1 alkaline phosphatase family protein [Fusibacter ferrireducens]
MRHKLIVISLDALQTTDLDYLKQKDNFSKILSEGALVKNVREIYPTLTYPIHTSIITGMHPNRHGIPHNQLPTIEPENPDWSIMGSDWYWYSDYVKVPSLMDFANEEGLTTASVMWPVMAGKKPTHNLAEIWPNRHEPVVETFKRACTESVMDLYYEQYIESIDWSNKKEIDMDGYSVPIAADMIRRFDPDLMLIHSVCLDHERHVSGVEGERIHRCLDRVDEIVGHLMDASKATGSFEKTNFILLGDHGQLAVRNHFALNVIFVEMGLIRLDENGKVIDYDAYSFSGGFSTHIMLKNPEDEVLKESVYRALLAIERKYDAYISRIFNKEEVNSEEGLSGEFTFVIEGAEGVMFNNELRGEIIKAIVPTKSEGYKGMHGHHPSKGHKPPFIAFGPDVLSGVVIETGDLLDICPTLSQLMGFSMTGLSGKAFPIIKS